MAKNSYLSDESDNFSPDWVNNTEQLDNEVDNAIPEELPAAPIVPEVNKLDKWEELLQSVQKLKPAQEQAEKNMRNATLLQAAGQLGQSFATGYGAHIGANEQGVKAAQDMAQAPVREIEQSIKSAKEGISSEKLANEAREAKKMSDPQSDISKFYREQAYSALYKLYPDKQYDLEQMSAGQLLKSPMLKSLFEGAREKTLQQSQYIHSKTGDPLVFNPNSGQYTNALTGELVNSKEVTRPIAYTDPISGLRAYFGPGGMQVPGLVKPNAPAPSGTNNNNSAEPTAPQERPTVGDYRNNGLIQSKEWDTVVTKDKEGFEKQNGDKLKIISSLKGVDSLVDEATTNPNAANALGGIIASFFEPGRLTDEDAKRYVGRLGIENKVKDWINTSSQGVITPELAKQIKATANAYVGQMDNIVRKNAEKYAKATQSSLINGRKIDTGVLADFYYQPDSNMMASPPQGNNIVTIKGPSGQTVRMDKEKAQKYLGKPGYELVK